MARPLRIRFAGAVFHVVCRGNERRSVFYDERDRRRFLGIMQDSAEMYGVKVLAYCLMTNHIHLLLQTPDWEGDVPAFMKRLLGAYTIRFNLKHKRVGHLFQGRYSAFLVQTEEYLLECSRYIHLNPVRAGMVAEPEDYRWSSMREYLGLVPGFCDPREVLRQFSDLAAYGRFVSEAKAAPRDILCEVKAGLFLGSEAFAEAMKDRFGRDVDPGVSQRRALIRREIGRVLPAVEGQPKPIQMYALREWAGRSQMEIADLFGLTKGAVSLALSRLCRRLEKCPELAAELERLRAVVNN